MTAKPAGTDLLPMERLETEGARAQTLADEPNTPRLQPATTAAYGIRRAATPGLARGAAPLKADVAALTLRGRIQMRRLHSRRAHLNQSSTVIFFIMSHASSSAARVMMQVWQTAATRHASSAGGTITIWCLSRVKTTVIFVPMCQKLTNDDSLSFGKLLFFGTKCLCLVLFSTRCTHVNRDETPCFRPDFGVSTRFFFRPDWLVRPLSSLGVGRVVRRIRFSTMQSHAMLAIRQGLRTP
jgi:hypothetical protein